eukprot:6520-Heterococcus_DN1.PRE.2
MCIHAVLAVTSKTTASPSALLLQMRAVESAHCSLTTCYCTTRYTTDSISQACQAAAACVACCTVAADWQLCDVLTSNALYSQACTLSLCTDSSVMH